MYTLDMLVPDCVGRYITVADSADIDLSSLINGRTYAKVWQSLQFWIVAQIRAGRSVSLAPLGVIVVPNQHHELQPPPSAAQRPRVAGAGAGSKQASRVGGRFVLQPAQSTTPKFLFLARFMNDFNLKVQLQHNDGASGDAAEQDHILPENKMVTYNQNVSTIAKNAGVDRPKAVTALSHLFRRLGEVLRCQEPVRIDFGIGMLHGHGGAVRFEFADPFAPAAATPHHGGRRDDQEGSNATPRAWRKHHHRMAGVAEINGQHDRKGICGSAQQGLIPPISDAAMHGAGRAAAVDGGGSGALKSADPKTKFLRHRYPLRGSPRKFRVAEAALIATEQAKHRMAEGRRERRGVDDTIEPFASLLAAKSASPTDPATALHSHLPAIGGRRGSGSSSSNMIARDIAALDQLPHATTRGFRRRLKGVAPLQSIRLSVEKRVTSNNNGSSSATKVSNSLVHKIRSQLPSRLPSNAAAAGGGSGNSSSKRLPLQRSMSLRTDGGTELGFAGGQMGQNLPPVLDAFARTRASTYTEQKYYSSISSKIASFYTPQAAAWSIDPKTHDLINTGFVPYHGNGRDMAVPFGRKNKSSMMDSALFERSLHRLRYYIEHMIPSHVVAPMKEEWIRNSLSLLAAEVPLLTETRVQFMVQGILVALRTDYVDTVKRAILNYVLLNPDECARLQIFLPLRSLKVTWRSSQEVLAHSHLAWRPSIQNAYKALSLNLYCNNPAVLALLKIWQDYEHIILLDLPSKDELPMTVVEFERRQMKHMESVRTLIVSDWISQVENVFSAYVAANGLTDENSNKFFDIVAVIMSRQLRSIVENSVKAYHKFFVLYKQHDPILFDDKNGRKLNAGAATDNDGATGSGGVRKLINIVFPMGKAPHRLLNGMNSSEADANDYGDIGASLVNEQPPVFKQTLQVHRAKGLKAKIRFEISLQHAEVAVVRIFDSMLKCLKDISRVESSIFAILDETKYLMLNVDGPAGDYMRSLQRDVTTIFNRSVRESALYMSLYDDYTYLLDESVRVARYLEGDRTLEEYGLQVAKYREVTETLYSRVHNRVRTPMILCSSTAVNKVLIASCKARANQILSFVCTRLVDNTALLCDRFKTVRNTLRKTPSTSVELVNLAKYLNDFRDLHKPRLIRDCIVARTELFFLYEQKHSVTGTELNAVWAMWKWLKQVDDLEREGGILMDKERAKMEAFLEQQYTDLGGLLDSYTRQVKQFELLGDMKEVNDYISRISTLKDNLAKLEKDIATHHEQQRLLELSQSDFYKLGVAKELLAPYEKLWLFVADFTAGHHEWMRGPVFTLNSDEIEAEAERIWKGVFVLHSQLEGHSPEPAAVAGQIKNELKTFRAHLPLLRILCNKGMRARHWSQVSDIVGFDLRPDKHTSLTRVLDMGIDTFVDRILEISDAASKEYAIETAVTSMRDEWKGVEVVLKPHRSGTDVLQGDSVEEIQTLLDDHLVKVQSMIGSPSAQPFIEDIKDWSTWVSMTQDIVEAWLSVQTDWMYLQPVFGAEDITKQMPAEGTMFKLVDSKWRQLMVELAADTRVLSIATIPNALSTLRESKQLLEEVQAGLNHYLETKRLFFPRFFFLSNDELLEILSETNDPVCVQPHLIKCFDGIASVQFEPNLDITGLISAQGEHVQTARVINPNDSKGSVEAWLKELDLVMCETVKSKLSGAINAFSSSANVPWIESWPAQVILAANQIFWTRGVEDALAKGEKALRGFLEQCNDVLERIVLHVRGDISKLLRTAMGALIVLQVHARDVVEGLIDANVTDVTSFDWASQLRYYWSGETCTVRMLTCALDYGYEYIGNTPRLVFTPLTDRCYRTLMSALQLNLGGAPEGPAGTGKTETVKDLAKAVGIQCVVFNCSEGLDYKAMGKFFKGLAASGAWACFDEFNRIDLEVLSVIAQQIGTILHAKTEHRQSFMFEGTELTLRDRCAVFITMNPGYAGRSELPDNLKTHFRAVAMMVPDYAMIAEIMLFSYGFVEAQALSRKIVATYRLCSEQLSLQDHYDYGMRAVKAVLTAAHQLKRKVGSAGEPSIIKAALLEVNLPKFLPQDLVLFEGIIDDLFRDVALPSSRHIRIEEAAKKQCIVLGLEPQPHLLDKVLQLYDTMNVRHGLMLVGLPFAGKTSCYRILEGALNMLHAEGNGSSADSSELPVSISVINPKAMTLGQLYGRFSEASHDWTDGILATRFRRHAADSRNKRNWIVFDGPVDALWVENLNTVLDDNRKLCLTSGEVVRLADNMNIVFEVRDLAEASPATVSRCGMVYMDPAVLSWEPITAAWIRTLPSGFDEAVRARLQRLFEWLVPPCLRVVQEECTKYAATSAQNLVTTMIRIFDGIITDEWNDAGKIEELGALSANQIVESLFLFSLVWSIGNVVDGAGRKRFDRFLREVSHEVNFYKLSAHFPKKQTVYSYVFNREAMRWMTWESVLASQETDARVSDGGAANGAGAMSSFQIPVDAHFDSILVPTVDTARYGFLLDLFVKRGSPALLVGQTGTGKSVYVKNKLRRCSPAKFCSLELSYSATTNVNTVQSLIDERLDKRRRGVYGAPLGKKLIVFIDDVNMPQRQRYGAQPPVELLRQFLCQQGWYDHGDRTFHKLQDVQMLASMGETGGGRLPLSDRFLRHFAHAAVPPADEATMQHIFGTILNWHLLERNEFGGDVQSVAMRIVNATNDVYMQVKAKLLPTPSKSHYTFNLRDVSRVIEGLTFSDPDHFPDSGSFIRLWVHEVHRVFADRLVDDADATVFLDIVRNATKKHLNRSFDVVLKHLDNNADGKVDTPAEVNSLYFGEYMSKGHPRPYIELNDAQDLRAVWSKHLDEYNALNSKPMMLVMFRLALMHLSRISRVLRQPRGHLLLVGVGGSGKQSLTRLAAHVVGCDIMQIELFKSYGYNEWREDLRKLLRLAGGEGKKTVFLITDQQFTHPQFLEDLNHLLNSGEVPNLWDAESRADILQLMRSTIIRDKDARAPSQLFSLFTERVRRHLHIVVSMSPKGAAFRERVRMFPSLVNCCTIDWFQPWPADALSHVAHRYFAEAEISLATRDTCVELCMKFHRAAEELADRMWAEVRRRSYVTPTSFLRLVNNFQCLLKQQRILSDERRKRYVDGLASLKGAEKEVKVMQAELEQLQPVLTSTSEKTAEMVDTISKQTVEARKIRESVSVEEKTAKHAADAAKAIESECANDLKSSLPILEAAISALNTVTTQDISELRSMHNPPRGVKIVMEALCIIKRVAPIKVPDPSASGKYTYDYWEPSKKLILTDPKMLRSLRNFDKDNIPPKIIKKLGVYLTMPDFDTEKIRSVSHAAHALCCWLYAIKDYDRAVRHVRPKREALERAKKEYSVVRASLDRTRAQLDTAEAKIAKLQSNLNVMQAKRLDLEEKRALCSEKILRAHTLLDKVRDEKIRWAEKVEEFSSVQKTLTGDTLLSAAFISHLGPFPPEYRSLFVRGCLDAVKAAGLDHSENYSLSRAMGNPVDEQKWIAQGLPNDSMSVDNVIIMNNGDKWPLLIDPQEQAARWLHNSLKGKNVVVLRPEYGNYLRSLENAVQFGASVVLEGVGSMLDAVLDPLLKKEVRSKSGGGKTISIGDHAINYSDDFELFITTKLANPHYLPDTAGKVNLINFCITPAGLQDQALAVIVAMDKPELEGERGRLIVTRAETAKQLVDVENEILHHISSSKGSILDDVKAIDALSASKAIAVELVEKRAIAEQTEKQIERARTGYLPAAKHVSVLYFAVADLGNVDSMYQYSLDWFLKLFRSSFLVSAQSHVQAERVESIKNAFTSLLYSNVSRSMFEAHKPMLSFLMCCRLLLSKNAISNVEWRFLLTGGVALSSRAVAVNPCSWLSAAAWAEVTKLSAISSFEGLQNEFAAYALEWREVYNSAEPWVAKFPGEWDTKLHSFQKLLVIRCIRPDKVPPAVRAFVKARLGAEFVDPPPFDLEQSFKSSSVANPLIFILSAGSNPTQHIMELARKRHRASGEGAGTSTAPRQHVKVLALGQGQGPAAEAELYKAAENGTWLVLQNCHLALSWMPRLEQLCAAIRRRVADDESGESSVIPDDAASMAVGNATGTHDENVPAAVTVAGKSGDGGAPSFNSPHADFRLWLTSVPHEKFPVSILHSSVKISTEAPHSIRGGMLRSYGQAPISDPQFSASCCRSQDLQAMTFSLCFFHSLVQEIKEGERER